MMDAPGGFPMGTLNETYEVALDALLDRVDVTLAETGERFPYVADPHTGEWSTTDDGNWCAGHWIGLLWLAAEQTADMAEQSRYESAAYEYVDRMLDADELLESMFGVCLTSMPGFAGTT